MANTNTMPEASAPSTGNLRSPLLNVLEPVKTLTAFQASKRGNQGFLSDLNRALAVATLTGLVVLAIVIIALQQGEPPSLQNKVLVLLMVAIAAAALGGFAGFVFGAVGEEKQSFGNMASVINGIVGGFTLSDLGRSDGVIRTILRSLAFASAAPVGLIACVIAFFGTAGFVCMYVNKQYLLNPELSGAKQLAEQNEAIGRITRSIRISQTDIGASPKTDPESLKQIQAALETFESLTVANPAIVSLLPLETLKSYSKAYYVINKYDRAETVLRSARSLAPDDPDVLFYLSHVLITAERPTEAIPFLRFLVTQQNATVLSWKLLGYACLFDPDRLSEAEDATKKYLCIYPHDFGAKLNLACVYGQRGLSEENKKIVIPILREVVAANPSSRDRIKNELTKPGEDFAEWKEDKEFQAL